MTTKEKIADEALTLFSAKGYKGTSVKNIADAVGIKDSSLYKHFKSKKDIFYSIVKQMQNRMSGLSFQVGLPAEQDCETQANTYGKFTTNALCALARGVFLFYLKDDFVSRFWKMAMMEQYHSPEIYTVYHKIFMEDSITYQTNLFHEMIKQGYFIAADPEIMAINFYSPIFFLLSRYMGKPEEENTALNLLDKQIREFCRIYQSPGK